MEFRHFCPADYEAVCGFLTDLNRRDRSHIHWNWARFEWMAEHPEFDRDSASSIGLWQDAGRIVGAAIYDMYFGEGFCAALPGYEDLYPEILKYAARELRDDAGFGLAICDGSAREIAAAETLGFEKAEQAETLLRLDLAAPLAVKLPEGYGITELDPAKEPYDFQWLLWRGFDHGTDRAAFEREDPVVIRRRPHLNPRLSLTALAPDGEKAAYCCVWYRPRTDYAYVEPVCTVPAHRGRGLASALLSEALNRARLLGAKEAWVISDLNFYKKLRFTDGMHATFYWKR